MCARFIGEAVKQMKIRYQEAKQSGWFMLHKPAITGTIDFIADL